MRLYFLMIRIAACFGHAKARKLIAGQRDVIKQLVAYSHDLKASDHILWIHVASVGEFEQARPLIERYHAQWGKERKIVLTFFSPSGYELRKDYAYVDKVFYLPFATQANAARFLDLIRPEKAIFVKYEFWPAYLKELKRRGIPTLLISAIFRKEQLFFRPWGKGYLKLLTCFDHLYVQDESSAQLLQEHGIEPVEVLGDTRFDRVAAVKEQAKDLAVVKTFCGEARKVVVAGSTWMQDEVLLAQYMDKHRDVKLVLVPHEIGPKRMHEIFRLFEGRFARYTEADHIDIAIYQVLVVDTIGVLSSIYRYGQVAYIGGGFGDGIHNTLEAAVYGMPVVFGPKWQRFREAKELLQAGAARSINCYDELEQALDEAFIRQDEMGKAAETYVKSELGATDRILDRIDGKSDHQTKRSV